MIVYYESINDEAAYKCVLILISMPLSLFIFSFFYRVYRLIALAPSTPATAEATAMTTFRIMSQRDFFIAITFHTSFPTFLMVNYSFLYGQPIFLYGQLTFFVEANFLVVANFFMVSHFSLKILLSLQSTGTP